MQRDLVERAKGGDRAAFTELASRSIDRLFSVACLILRDDERAKDATQEALIAAWRDLSALRDPDRFEAWLHRLLVRSCYREARRHRRLGVGETRVVALDDRSPDPGTEVAVRDQLDRAFRRLAEDQRAVIVLHYYLGLPLSEVAEVLAVPDGTAKSRLHRATAAMRAALEADARPTRLSEGYV